MCWCLSIIELKNAWWNIEIRKAINMLAVLSRTRKGRRNVFPDSRSTPPNAHCPSTAWLLLYSRWLNGCHRFWQSCWGIRSSENVVQLGPSTDAHVGKCGQERGKWCRTWGKKPQWNWRIYINAQETKKLSTWHHTHTGKRSNTDIQG